VLGKTQLHVHMIPKQRRHRRVISTDVVRNDFIKISLFHSAVISRRVAWQNLCRLQKSKSRNLCAVYGYIALLLRAALFKQTILCSNQQRFRFICHQSGAIFLETEHSMSDAFILGQTHWPNVMIVFLQPVFIMPNYR